MQTCSWRCLIVSFTSCDCNLLAVDYSFLLKLQFPVSSLATTRIGAGACDGWRTDVMIQSQWHCISYSDKCEWEMTSMTSLKRREHADEHLSCRYIMDWEYILLHRLNYLHLIEVCYWRNQYVHTEKTRGWKFQFVLLSFNHDHSMNIQISSSSFSKCRSKSFFLASDVLPHIPIINKAVNATIEYWFLLIVHDNTCNKLSSRIYSLLL